MPENLTLVVYLEKRGSVKALTRIEADVFGVPYPLQKGWAHRHGTAPITQEMLDQLQQKIGRAKSSTAEKAQRGLDAVEGVVPAPAGARRQKDAVPADTPRAPKVSLVPGFVLRQARRYAMKKQARGVGVTATT